MKLKRRTEQRPGASLMLALGSSRLGYGFEALYAERQIQLSLSREVVCFNFGIPAAGPTTELLYLRRLFFEGIKPDLLLIEVLPALLHDEGSRPREAAFFPDRAYFQGEIEQMQRYGMAEDALRTRSRSLICPAYGLRLPLLSRIVPSWLPWHLRNDWSRLGDDAGWLRIQHTNLTDEQTKQHIEQARREYESTLQALKLGGPAMLALIDLLQLCHMENVPVQLLLMPEGNQFRSWYNDAALNSLREVCEQYGVELIDARAWVPDDCFADQHHLLPSGARQFTEQLIRKSLLPALSGRLFANGETPR